MLFFFSFFISFIFIFFFEEGGGKGRGGEEDVGIIYFFSYDLFYLAIRISGTLFCFDLCVWLFNLLSCVVF